MNFKPVLSNEFNSLLKQIGLFEDKPQIALALSGGVDSSALMCLLNKWVLKKKGTLKVPFHRKFIQLYRLLMYIVTSNPKRTS